MSKNLKKFSINDIKNKVIENKSIRWNIEVPEWNAIITIKPITLEGKLSLTEYANNIESNDIDKNLKITIKLLQMSLIDNDNNIMTEEEVSDLIKNDTGGIETILNEIMKKNGLSTEGVDQVKKDFLATKIDNSNSN